MARKTSLTVNSIPVELDYFVGGYVYHVVAGIVASLKDTGTIKNLELDVAGDDRVQIALNGVDVPLNYFATQIIQNTLAGMVSNLRGVTEEMRTLELRITQ